MSDEITTNIEQSPIIQPRLPSFEEQLPFIEKQIEYRRKKWTLTTLDWDDCKQLILIRIWQKYAQFDPSKGPFEHWLNRLISHALINILRDHLYRWQRPCVRDGGCVYNLGTGHCGFTSNGLQCNECPLYKEWVEKRESEYNIKSSLALEHHAQEVSSIQSDFMDIEGKKKVIDEKMKAELGQWEWQVYKHLYIMYLTPLEATKALEKVAATRKRPLRPTDPIDYQAILKLSKTYKEMMLDIIKREDL
jgi:hypothetical protein